MNRRSRKKLQRRLVESGTGEEGLPLCAAAGWGHDAAVRELLAAGADPHRREDHGRGRTALEWAGAHGHHGTVALLRPSTVPPARAAEPDGEAATGR